MEDDLNGYRNRHQQRYMERQQQLQEQARQAEEQRRLADERKTADAALEARRRFEEEDAEVARRIAEEEDLGPARRLQAQLAAEEEGVRPADDHYQEQLIGGMGLPPMPSDWTSMHPQFRQPSVRFAWLFVALVSIFA